MTDIRKTGDDNSNLGKTDIFEILREAKEGRISHSEFVEHAVAFMEGVAKEVGVNVPKKKSTNKKGVEKVLFKSKKLNK